MQQLFVPPELAMLAKDRDWNEQSFAYYSSRVGQDDELFVSNCYEHDQYYNQICMAPLYQQLIDWFEKEHKLSIEICYNGSESWYWLIRELKLFGKEWLSVNIDENEYRLNQKYDCCRSALTHAFTLI